MPSGSNESGPTVLPGGVDIVVPDLTVARPLGVIVYNTGASPGLYVSTNASVATYTYIGGAAAGGGFLWDGQVDVVGLLITGNPEEGNTATVNVGAGASDVTYTFTATPAVATDVLIGGSAAATQANLEAAVLANQSAYLSATDFGGGDPLFFFVLDADNTISSSSILSGAGAITHYNNPPSFPNPIGQARIAPQNVIPFHISYDVTAVNVTNGYILFTLPEGQSFVGDAFGILVYDGTAKGTGEYAVATKACTASLTAAAQTSTGQWYIQLVNEGATQFAATDRIVFWGLAATA